MRMISSPECTKPGTPRSAQLLQTRHPDLHTPGADPSQVAFLDAYFDSQVYPVLTPLAIDPAHPFPHVHNKSLNLLLRIEANKPHARPLYAVLQVTAAVLSRLVPLPNEADGQHRFVLLEDVIGPTARRSFRRLPYDRVGRLSRDTQ